MIVVLEAMKMEQPLNAHKAGTVTGLTAEVGCRRHLRRDHLRDQGLSLGSRPRRIAESTTLRLALLRRALIRSIVSIRLRAARPSRRCACARARRRPRARRPWLAVRELEFLAPARSARSRRRGGCRRNASSASTTATSTCSARQIGHRGGDLVGVRGEDLRRPRSCGGRVAPRAARAGGGAGRVRSSVVDHMGRLSPGRRGASAGGPPRSTEPDSDG